MKIVIVGGGVMGLSTAWAARRAGHEVTLVEQGPLPNPLASSVDHNRLIRYPYGPMPGYADLVADAYDAWALLWRELGVCHYQETGTLALAYDNGDFTDLSRAWLRDRGIAHTTLSPARVERAFPHVRGDDIAWALHSPSGGVLAAARICASLVEHVRARGVTLAENARVVGIEPERGEVTLDGGEVLRADAIAVTAGAWLPRLFPAMAKKVTPSRQVVVYAEPPPQHADSWARGPMVLDIGGGGLYCVPPAMGTPLKLADHRYSMSGDPEADRDPRADEAAPILERARARLRDADDYRIDSLKTCFYSVTHDERFVAEPVGERCFVISPCSGHGFKFAPIVGLATAAALARTWEPERLSRYLAGESAPRSARALWEASRE